MANDIQLIGIDTNILARYIVQDEPTQAKIASEFLESLNQHQKGFVSNIVLVELIWLLKRVYKQSRLEIAHILEALLFTDVLVFENHPLIIGVSKVYQSTASNFSDLLISRIHQQNGCIKTVTFDENAVKKADMTLLDA